ncbi:MAG: hypothetical protein PVH68_07545 [Armatimonadota bacterium]
MPGNDRRLDLLAFGAVALVITVLWLPTLTSSGKVVARDDFFLRASRHEHVRKSIVEHHTVPLRSHWFGGGYPTLGEPADPALNPLVLLSVAFGSAMGLKLIGFVAVLASGLGTYALARYILDFTRWGALFAALLVGAGLFVPDTLGHGDIGELCAAYLPLCMLLVGLSCRGRTGALYLLPFVLYTMLSDGKQAFFTAMLYLGFFCLLDAVPMFRKLAPSTPARKLDSRALRVLLLALGVTLFVGMARILPALEFINARGGLTDMELYPYTSRIGEYGGDYPALLQYVLGVPGRVNFVTVGWLPLALFAIAACCFWKRSLPWVIAVVLFSWLLLGPKAPFDLFALLQGLPVFSAIAVACKFLWFQIVLSIALGAGQFFWVLRKLRHGWVEHVCAVALIVVAVGFLYPKSTLMQRRMYIAEVPAKYVVPQEEFYHVRGANLRRNRLQPPRALTYLNVLQNIGTIDWFTAIPMAENAIPRYFVNAADSYIPNPQYRGEAFFPGAAEPSPEIGRCAFGPNSITVRVTVRRPSILVINQNYHAAWRTNRGQLFDKDGLIGVRLRETGSYAVELRYLPRSFVVGLAVSVLSVLGWTLACFGIRRGAPTVAPSADVL